MRGKEKCKALKEIRRRIAEENDIEYAVAECKFQGDCKGTCPKCEAELAYLEKELKAKQALGKAVVVAGLSLGTVSTLGGCAVTDFIIDRLIDGNTTAGVIAIPDETTTGEMPMEEQPDDDENSSDDQTSPEENKVTENEGTCTPEDATSAENGEKNTSEDDTPEVEILEGDVLKQ